MIHKKTLQSILFTIDLTFFSIFFSILHYEKFSVFIPYGNYLYLYFIFLIFRNFTSFYYERTIALIQKPLWLVLRITFWSTLICILFVVIIISFSNLWSTSRLFILTLTIILFLYDIFVSILFKAMIKSTSVKVKYSGERIEIKGINKFYIKWLIPGILLLFFTYICTYYIKYGSFQYDLMHEQNLLILIASWGLGTLLTNRYKEPNSINHYYEIAPYIKASILTILFITLFYYILRIDSDSISLIFNAGIFHSGIEITAFYLFFFGESKKNGIRNKRYNKIPLTDEGQNELEIENIGENNKNTYTRELLKDSIKTFGFAYQNQLIKFIWNAITDEQIEKNKVSIFNTDQTVNIKLLFNDSKKLIINVNRLNDCRRINEYLLANYKKLESGGILVGNFVPLEKFRIHLRSKMPHFLYLILLPFHFLFHRVFPKLMITKQIYFILTKGKNRILSKSEIFGRLSFCGFEIIDENLISDRLYFVCKKKKTISKETSPSYGPIVKLKRIGYEGKLIYIYKIRTMYPYSEFIQGDIYEKYHLDKTGKLQGDYRITSWGKIFRKYFIDEIPQLYNWLKGDLNFIGVRALSEHYYSLYPKDLQEKRINFKPGLIPPYYADLPKSFDGIIESERTYLNQKEKSPLFTDLKYFIKALSNIIFLGARSK